jgi:hypothetical protein
VPKGAAHAGRGLGRGSRHTVAIIERTRAMIDLVKDQLDALPSQQLRRPFVPIATALQEAHDLLELCRGTRVSAALVEVGMAPDFIRDFEVRIQAARDAQSAWMAFRDRSKPIELAELETQASALRRAIMFAARFSLRHLREAQLALAAIRNGIGVDDLIQDLFDLAAILEKHAPAFDADRSFDVLARIAEARDLARKLSLAVSETRLGAEAAATRDLRNRAFTYMDDLVLELRLAGRYAFRDDPETSRRFASRYLRKRRLQAKRADGTEDVTLDVDELDELEAMEDELREELEDEMPAVA